MFIIMELPLKKDVAKYYHEYKVGKYKYALFCPI